MHVSGASPECAGDPVIPKAHCPFVSEPPLGFSSNLPSLSMLSLQILLGIHCLSGA